MHHYNSVLSLQIALQLQYHTDRDHNYLWSDNIEL